MEYWKANKDIHDQVLKIVGRNHPDLALVSSEIAVVFREKAGKSGGQAILGSARKAPALINALSNSNYAFILELGADVWENELTSMQREALLDHLLTACRAEDDPKSGDVKYSVAKPDIMAFRENIERYGMWFPKDEKKEEESPIEDMFGGDKP